MAVNITQDELDLFGKNGISENDIQNTVNAYRQEGVSDEDIRAKFDTKLNNFRLEGGIKVYNQSRNPIRNALRQAGRNTARFLMPKKAENWFLGSKEDEEFLKKYNDDNVLSYEDARALYDQGSMSKDEFLENVKLRSKLNNLQADADYRDVRNKNIGKGIVDIGTAFIPVGGGGAIAAKGASLLKPVLGKRIAAGLSNGAVVGAKAGAIHGVASGIVDEDINPLIAGVQEGIGGSVFGGALGLGGEKIVQGINARKLKNHKPFEQMTQQERKAYQKLGKKYYKDYLQGTTVNKKGYGKVYFNGDNAGENAIHNLDIYPVLKKQIKSSKVGKSTNDKQEIDRYYDHLLNEHNGEPVDHIVEVIDDSGKRYKMTKKIEPNQQTGSTPVADQTLSNNIIDDVNGNINPNEWNGTVGVEVPQGNSTFTIKPDKHTYQQQLEEALGLTEENWDKAPDFYSKEKEEEAFQILSEATGKSVKWLKSQLKTGKNGRGTAKRQEFINLLLEHTDDHLDFMPQGKYKYYDTSKLSYDNSGSNSDMVGEGTKLAERVYNDIVNRNFDLDPRDPLGKALDSANLEYKKFMRDVIDGKIGAENIEDGLHNIFKELPEEYANEFWQIAGRDLKTLEDVRLSNQMRERGDLKPSQLAQKSDLPPEIKENVTKYPPEYEVLHNKDLMINARDEIAKDPSSRLARLDDMTSKEKPMSAQDFEEARQLIGKLYQEGRIDEALSLTQKVSAAGSKAGQAVQAMSLWSKTTPEGAIKQAQKIIDEYNQSARKKIPPLSEEQAQEILNLVDDIQKSEAIGDRAKDVATGKLMKYFGELVPQSMGNKLKTLRNITLLLNGKTFARNISGNAIFAGMENAVTKPIAAGLDKIASLFTKQRTRTAPQLSDYGKGLVQGTKEGIEDVNLGIDTRQGIGGRFDLPQRRSFTNTPVLSQLEKALDFSLRVPDRAFYQATFNESLANQMKAAGVKEPTEQMLNIANAEALESVYQNNGQLANMISGVRQGLNRIGMKDFGLGDALIPYAQTPANVAQQGINYSPLGIINAIKSGLQGNQRQATLDTARAITGSGMIGGGYLGAKNGLFTPNIDDYQTRKNYEALGVRPNQMVLPNGSLMSYSQLQPLAAPISTGAVLSDVQDGNYIQAADRGFNTLADLGMLRGVSDFTKNYNDNGIVSALMNTVTSLPSQYIGTGINQLNAYIDPYQRETYDPNPIVTGLNQARAKTPLLSKTLPKRYDVTGREVQKYDSKGIKKVFDTFINPVFVNKPKDDLVMQEVTALYELTGEKSGLLNLPEKKIKLDDGTSKQLNNKEFSEYSKVLGELTYHGYDKLMKTDRYQYADDMTRLRLLSDIKQNAKSIAQEELFGKVNKNTAEYKQTQKALNKLHRGQTKLERLKRQMDNQLIQDIMY